LYSFIQDLNLIVRLVDPVLVSLFDLLDIKVMIEILSLSGSGFVLCCSLLLVLTACQVIDIGWKISTSENIGAVFGIGCKFCHLVSCIGLFISG